MTKNEEIFLRIIKGEIDWKIAYSNDEKGNPTSRRKKFEDARESLLKKRLIYKDEKNILRLINNNP